MKGVKSEKRYLSLKIYLFTPESKRIAFGKIPWALAKVNRAISLLVQVFFITQSKFPLFTSIFHSLEPSKLLPLDSISLVNYREGSTRFWVFGFNRGVEGQCILLSLVLLRRRINSRNPLGA